MQELKQNLLDKINTLSEDRQKEIMEYYDKHSIEALVFEIYRDARTTAQSTIDHADRKGYGYGEVGYYLEEDIKDFTEDTPELAKEYKRLVYGFFNRLIETKE